MDYTIKRHRCGGLDLYDYHARQQDAKLGRFNSPDPLAHKYYWLSPYSYCGGDPVNCVDPDGRDVCVLTAPNGAQFLSYAAGHSAILIQKQVENGDKQWFLYSKNGTDENRGIYGVSKGDDIATGKSFDDKVGWNSPEEFLASSHNLDENGNVEYTEGYLIPCSSDQDANAEKGAIEYLGNNEAQKDYNLVSRNCIQTVQNALKEAGKNPGKGRIPNNEEIKKKNDGSTISVNP